MEQIFFNTDKVSKIIDGKKSETRKLAKSFSLKAFTDAGFTDEFIKHKDNLMTNECCYKVDDILCVREEFAYGKVEKDSDGKFIVSYPGDDKHFLYKEWFVRNNLPLKSIRWSPSIYMPRDAVRIFLKVLEIKLQRLQDITEEEAIREGFSGKSGPNDLTAREKFKIDWDLTISKNDYENKRWNANPWVWVILFD